MRKIHLLLPVVVVLLFIPHGYSKVTVCTVQSKVVENQGILPNTNGAPHHPWQDVIGRNAVGEGYIIIFSLNLASDSGQQLVSVSLEMDADIGFSVDSSVITDGSGTILGVTGGVRIITIPAGRRPILPKDAEVFYIAIRTSDTCLDGSRARFTIPDEGVSVTPASGEDVPKPGASTDFIVCELRIVDVLPNKFDNAHSLGVPMYPAYSQYQPGEMIRPRYDRVPMTYDYAKSPLPIPSVPLIHKVPQVIPWETPKAVLAIACRQRNVTPSGNPEPNVQNPPEALNSITLIVTDTGIPDFDPNNFFRNRNIMFYKLGDPFSLPGITLWKDNNNNGIWEPTEDILLKYQMSSFTPTQNPREWQVTLTPAESTPETIGGMADPEYSPTTDPKYDFLIVITIASAGDTGVPNITIGGDFKLWIPQGGILFGPLSYPQQYAGIPSSKVKDIYHNLYVENICQAYVDPTDSGDTPDLTSNVIPVFGLNIASGPADFFTAGEYIQRIRIDLLAYENVDPDDIAPLRDDNYSGLTLWRDNKNPPVQNKIDDDYDPIGNFDVTDTLIPCKFSSNPSGPYDFHWAFDGYDASIGAYRYHTYMAPTGVLTDIAAVYSDDAYSDTTPVYRGDDFFVCLRTNKTLPYGSAFRLYLPANEIILNGSKYGVSTHEVFSTRMTGNVFTKLTPLVLQGATITPQSAPTPVMKVEITDNNSGKTPTLTGITVEFYNRGGFTLDDLASFTTLAAWYDVASGWFNVTNFSVDALKQCGVVIYRGSAAGPDWNSPVLISRYKYLTSSMFDTPPGYVLEFQQPVTIPCTLYVVIITSASMSPGDAFSVGIVGWGGFEVDWNTWASRAIPVVDKNNTKSNAYARKCTEPFNFALSGTLDLYANPGFDGITLGWANRTNVNQSEFISYEIWRTDSVHGETAITVIPVPAGWSASSYFDAVTREGIGGLIDGVTYNYRLIMRYERSGQEFTLQSNRVSTKVYGFPISMTPSTPTVVASTNGISIWFRDNSQEPYKATSWRIQRAIEYDYKRKLPGDLTVFTDVTTVDTIPTFYAPYLDTTIEFDVLYRYRVIALREVGSGGQILTAESYPSGLSERTAIYSNDPGTGPVDAPSGGGGGCFIATAAFGTPFAKEIGILRQFRDRILMKCDAGKRFVQWYYRHSPAAASYISQHPVIKFFVRALLYPVIAFAWIVLHKLWLYSVLVVVCVIALIRLRQKKTC